MNTKKIRNLHSTLGYLYVGLIISFALSGVMMNHREVWHPEKYTIRTSTIQLLKIPEKSSLTDDSVEALLLQMGVDDKVRRHMVKKDELRILCANHDVDVDLKSGKAEITEFRKTAFISQMMTLHKSTSNFWIYYSDIFGLSLAIIAITGLLLMPSKGRQRRRAIVLVIGGIVFPLIFVLLLAH